MTHEEQQAFIECYDTNVSMYTKREVERIVEGFYNGEDISLLEGSEHIIDCLMIWTASSVYQMKKGSTQ